MTSNVLYDDGRCLLDEQGVTLRGYYFPVGACKRIPYSRIERVHVRQMNWLTGKGRIWGTARPDYWFPFDSKRPSKEKLIVLMLHGKHVKPAFSPDDPDQVLRLLREHIDDDQHSGIDETPA